MRILKVLSLLAAVALLSGAVLDAQTGLVRQVLTGSPDAGKKKTGLGNAALEDDSYLHGLLARHDSGLMVLPGPAKMERTVFSSEQIQAALESLRSHFSYVVTDLRHDFDLGTLAALEASDTVLAAYCVNVCWVRASSLSARIATLRCVRISSRRPIFRAR